MVAGNGGVVLPQVKVVRPVAHVWQGHSRHLEADGALPVERFVLKAMLCVGSDPALVDAGR